MEVKKMYTPKISEDLIPHLYRIAKETKSPMTRIVDDILRRAIQQNIQENQENRNQKKEVYHERPKQNALASSGRAKNGKIYRKKGYRRSIPNP